MLTGTWGVIGRNYEGSCISRRGKTFCGARKGMLYDFTSMQWMVLRCAGVLQETKKLHDESKK